MHFSSIPALAAMLSLVALKAHSSVIPGIQEVRSSAGVLNEEAGLCIKDFCTTKGGRNQKTAQCGPVNLTVTYSEGLFSIEECISKFSHLITQDTIGGISQTEDALYEILVEDDGKPAAYRKRADLKTTRTTKAKSTAAKSTSKKPSKVSPVKPNGPEISSKPGGSKTPSIKPTGSKTSPKLSVSASPSASACPLPRKGKNGKPLQRRCAGDEFYKKRDLIVGKVTHWKFNTMGNTDTYNADANAKLILTEMKKNGQLDVVKVFNGDLTVVGNAKGGTNPNTFAKKGGNYLLTNGGFFQHMILRDRAFEPAGEDTMVKHLDGTVTKYQQPFPVPADYAQYYDQIDGLDNTRVHSGPNLKKAIPELTGRQGSWKYSENDPNLVGRLSHASQPNERIALVSFSKTYYIVAYTSQTRTGGVDTNHLKRIIDAFFLKMGETGKSISSSTQAVCLDGGPSISMTWNAGATIEKLSLGGAGYLTPAPGANGREVSNLIKIAAK